MLIDNLLPKYSLPFITEKINVLCTYDGVNYVELHNTNQGEFISIWIDLIEESNIVIDIYAITKVTKDLVTKWENDEITTTEFLLNNLDDVIYFVYRKGNQLHDLLYYCYKEDFDVEEYFN